MWVKFFMKNPFIGLKNHIFQVETWQNFTQKKKHWETTELKLGVQIGERPLRATPPGPIKLCTQSRAGARLCYAFSPAFKANYVKMLRQNHCAEPSRHVLTCILLIPICRVPVEMPWGKLISLLSMMAARGGFKPFVKMLELSAGVHFGACGAFCLLSFPYQNELRN
jgi:hypothetical protein